MTEKLSRLIRNRIFLALLPLGAFLVPACFWSSQILAELPEDTGSRVILVLCLVGIALLPMGAVSGVFTQTEESIKLPKELFKPVYGKRD